MEFGKYKDSVEYKVVNNRMTVEQFKKIYTVEYVHRKIGVYLGYTFGLPFGYFVYRGYLKPPMIKRMGALLLLGGFQGAIGYWMVKSGVNKHEAYQSRPRVSPYRLSVHLMMATGIYMGLFYQGVKLLVTNCTPPPEAGIKNVRNIRFLGILLIKCILLNIFSGALVAGIDAGKVYNTWPLMNGEVVPAEAKQVESWRSFFENKALVQFNHRNMAYITQTVSLLLGYKLYKSWILLPPMVKLAGGLTFLMINYQVPTGVIEGTKRNPDLAEPRTTGTRQPPSNDSNYDLEFWNAVDTCLRAGAIGCCTGHLVMYTC